MNTNLFLNTFDLLLEYRKEGEELKYFLMEGQKGYFPRTNFRELDQLITKVVNLFGPLLKAGALNFEKELESLRNDSWECRFWRIGNYLIHLHWNNAFHCYALLMQPISVKGLAE